MLYLSITILALLLTAIYVWVFTLNHSRKIRFWGVFSLVTIVMLFIVFLFNVSFDKLRRHRLDLTNNQAYTISSHTVKILKELQAPVTITYYVTPREKLPTNMKNLERDIRDMLQEMNIAVAGRMQFRIVRPETNSKLAEKLIQRNIKPRRVQSIDSDEFSLRMAFSSVEIQYLQQDPEIIEFVAPDDIFNLEYEIASRIYKLSFGADSTDYSDNSLFSTEKAAQTIYPNMPGQTVLYYVDNIGQYSARLPENMVGVRETAMNRLRALAAASKGKIVFQEPNPQTTQQLLFVLSRKGLLEGVSVESDTPTLELNKNEDAAASAEKKEEKVYSSVYMEIFRRDVESIPLVAKNNLDQLEVEINKKILRKLNKKKPKVAIYSPREKLSDEQMAMARQLNQLAKAQDKFSSATQMLRQGNYDVVSTDISKDSPIPADATTLVVLDPTQLSERQVYEIEKYLHQGRNLIIAGQRYGFDFSPKPTGGFALVPTKQEFKLEETLKNWGVELGADILFDKHMETLNISVRRPTNFGGFRVMAQSNEPVKTPAQIRLTDHNFNRENSFGNRVQRLLYFGGSRFRLDEEKLKKSSIEHEWIMKASDQAWSVEHKGGNLNLEPPTGQEKYLDKPELAMLLKGKFASTWKDKKVPYFMKEVDKTDETPAPPQRPGQPPAKPQMVPDSTTAEENQIVGEIHDSKVLLIGSSTIFKDDFMGDQNHQAFFLNCVDALTLGDDLIHIRAKATLDATLPLTTDSEKSFWKFFVIAFMPLVFGVIGMIIIVTGNVRANG